MVRLYGRSFARGERLRLIGVLSWYDEPVAALGQCLAGFKNAGVDHVVAMDGRYAMVRGDEHVSPEEQLAAIHMMCRHLGMGCTVDVPAGPWEHEMQKRSNLFMVALSRSDPGDWLLLQDADEVIVRAPDDLKDRLAESDREVGLITCRDLNTAAAKKLAPEKVPANAPEYFGVRKLFLAQPIVVTTNHYTYMTLDGRVLWSAAGEANEPEPSLDLRDVMEMHHRPGVRDNHRNERKRLYYGDRDEQKVEAGACAHRNKDDRQCGRLAARRVRVNPKRTPTGVVCQTRMMCEEHARKADRRLEHDLTQMDFLCGCGPYRKRGPEDVCLTCSRPVGLTAMIAKWVDQLDPAPLDEPQLAAVTDESAGSVAARILGEVAGGA